jgi:hypothetical protein
VLKKALYLVVVGGLVMGPVAALAQGTKDKSPGSQSSSGTRSGVGTNTSPDSIGGAFKGTGMPTYGTSSGMGDPKKQRN